MEWKSRARLAVGLALLALVTSGCVSFRRTTDSGYAFRDEGPTASQERRYAERMALLSELGFTPDKELEDEDYDALDQRAALKREERNLEGRRDKEQYYKNKPYMKSDRERVQFLKLSDFETRQRWLNAKGIGSGTAQHPPEIQSLVDVNDITTGMTKQAVKDSWGEPELVEVAGNPLYANERWFYSEQTSSAEGYQTERRTVYFESGLVIGWERR